MSGPQVQSRAAGQAGAPGGIGGSVNVDPTCGAHDDVTATVRERVPPPRLGAHLRAVSGTAVTNVVATGAGSIGGLILARALGPTHRGDLVTVLQWPAMIGSVTSIGVTQATCYWVANRPAVARRMKSTAATAALVTGGALAAAGPFIASMIGRNGQVIALLTAVFAAAPLYIVGGVWMSALQATSIARWNVARMAQPVLYLGAISVLWSVDRVSLDTVVGAFVGALAVQTAYAMVAARRTVGRHVAPERTALRDLYSYGVKVFAGTVPRLVNFTLDQLLLSVWPGVTPAALGNYAVAVSLSSLVLPVSQAFGSIAFPRVAAARSELEKRKIERWSVIGSALTSVVVIGVVSAVAPFAVVPLFGPGYHDAVVALWILAPGVVFLAVGRTLADILQGRGRPLVTSAAEGTGAVLTVVLLAVLIPMFGIRGAAAASTIVYTLVTAVLFWRVHMAREATSWNAGGRREVRGGSVPPAAGGNDA